VISMTRPLNTVRVGSILEKLVTDTGQVDLTGPYKWTLKPGDVFAVRSTIEVPADVGNGLKVTIDKQKIASTTGPFNGVLSSIRAGTLVLQLDGFTAAGEKVDLISSYDSPVEWMLQPGDVIMLDNAVKYKTTLKLNFKTVELLDGGVVGRHHFHETDDGLKVVTDGLCVLCDNELAPIGGSALQKGDVIQVPGHSHTVKSPTQLKLAGGKVETQFVTAQGGIAAGTMVRLVTKKADAEPIVIDIHRKETILVEPGDVIEVTNWDSLRAGPVDVSRPAATTAHLHGMRSVLAGVYDVPFDVRLTDIAAVNHAACSGPDEAEQLVSKGGPLLLSMQDGWLPGHQRRAHFREAWFKGEGFCQTMQVVILSLWLASRDALDLKESEASAMRAMCGARTGVE